MIYQWLRPDDPYHGVSRVSVLTRQIETSQTSGVIEFDDRAFTVSYRLQARVPGKGNTASKTMQFGDHESARACYARLIAGISGHGISIGLRLL